MVVVEGLCKDKYAESIPTSDLNCSKISTCGRFCKQSDSDHPALLIDFLLLRIYKPSESINHALKIIKTIENKEY